MFELIWGDNNEVISSLLPRFAGKINLIYIDPPFATGQDFSFDQPGTYKMLVKAVDIFGNDTTTLVLSEVEGMAEVHIQR